jgi:DNA-binding transcriptional MerR regulator
MNRSLSRLEHEKLYYSISEVCRMTGLEPHVLRCWETEFPQMRPRKNRAGNRAYRTREIQVIRYLRYLLHEEKYTILGAKKKMTEVSSEEMAGQVSLLKPYMLDGGKKKTAIREESPPDPSENLRRELTRIQEALRGVLPLLDGKG